MKDIMGLMKQAKEMQSKMENMQAELAEMEVEGSAGGDMVKVVMNGHGNMSSVTIDPSLLKEDETDIVEDLVMAAHNDAKAKLDVAKAEKNTRTDSRLAYSSRYEIAVLSLWQEIASLALKLKR